MGAQLIAVLNGVWSRWDAYFCLLWICDIKIPVPGAPSAARRHHGWPAHAGGVAYRSVVLAIYQDAPGQHHVGNDHPIDGQPVWGGGR